MSTAITIRPLSGIATAFAQFRSARDTIQDVTTSDPFGPLQPVKPWVEIDEPRGWQFAPGQNLIFTPRAQQQYSAVELQSLSMYPMARILIENVKDMVCRMPWQIRPRPQEGETSKALNQRRAGDKNVIALTKFFERPNPDQSWSEFIRQPLEDMLTIDAPAILMRRNKKQIVELRPIQGDTLNRLIDKNGFTPQPPDPAYQQLWYGQPMLNLTTDDLCYKPRNILPRDLYGTCYSSDTEILTRDRGFVLFKYLRQSDYVATRNPETHEFEWQKPTRFVNEVYSGEMIKFSSRSFDLLVTPEHRMLCSTSGYKGKRYEKLITARDFQKGNHRERRIPVTSSWNSGIEVGRVTFPAYRGFEFSIDGDDYCALMGAYIAEGNLRVQGGIEINQLRHSKGYEAYKELIERINGSDGYNGKAFVIGRRSITEHFAKLGLCESKYIPDEIKNAPRRQLEIFWKYFTLGDGHTFERESHTARGSHPRFKDEQTTTSRRLADDLVEIAQKLGWSASVGFRPAHFSHRLPNSKGKVYFCRESYHVRVRYSQSMSATCSTIQYNGSVHCVTVPNGIVYVRRNGKPCWSGNSPVQQAAQWLEVGIMRLAWQKNYYSASSIPDRVMVVPPGISPDKIAEQQMWMNSALAGNLWSRRQWKLIQGFRTDGHDQIIDAKEGALTDPFDDLLIRVLCYAFGTSPQRLLKMQNRATATSNQEAAEDEGLQPWLDWLRGVINWIIQLKMGFADYEFTFTPPQENDVLKQAQVHKIYLDSGVMVRSEVRDDIGLDPIDLPEMDEPGVFSPQNGFMPISGGIIVNGAGIGGSKQGPVGSEVPDEPPQPKVLPQNANGNQPSNPNEPQPPKGGKKPKAKPGSKDEGATGKAAHCRTHAEHNGDCNACLKADMNRIFKASGVAKAASLKRIKIDPTYSTPEIVKARSDMHALMLRIFHNQKEKASELAGRLLLKVNKAEQNPDDIADEIFDAIYGEFKDVPEEAIAYLRAAALAGAGKGISELGITDEDLIAKVNEGARDWAEDRAAEMVGMRRTDEGKLIPNPNAEWVISEETRDQIRKIVRDAFDDETKMQDIQQSIKEAGAFDDYRAEMISRSEISEAQAASNYSVWQDSGLVKGLTWEMSEEHTEECACEDNDGVTVPIGTPFPSGDFYPTVHPFCSCVVFVSSMAGESI